MKRNAKVRCVHCGAKNSDAVICRICKATLPALRNIRSATSFDENVERERALWRAYDQGNAAGEAPPPTHASLPD